MKKSKMLKNEAGIAHLALIFLFVFVLAGLSALAYTRINATDPEIASLETVSSEESQELDSGTGEDETDELDKATEEADKE
jgi:hypothetical protein